MSSRLDSRNFINIDLLPKKNGVGINKDKMVVDWSNSYGYIVDFICAGIKGKIEILTYYKKERKVDIKYKNNKYKLNTDCILNCEFGRNILKRFNLNYLYNVGDVVTVKNTKYKVLNHTRNSKDRKSYVVECLKCHEIVEKTEAQLTNFGCMICNGKKAKANLNDMWTTKPELAQLLANHEDGYNYTQKSNQKLDWICPTCGELIKDKMVISVHDNGLTCPVCGKTKSYPNRLMYALLSKLNVNFKNEKIFKWSDNKRYDFYLNNHKVIIEMNGKQHYDKDFFNTCEEVQKNDKYKLQLAINNGILEENYIVIDARYSDLDFIKNNILNSKLAEIIDLSNVDWIEIGKLTEINPLKEACRLWDSGIDDINEIASIIGYHSSKTSEFLRKGELLGITNYSRKVSKENGYKRISDTKYERYGKPFICIETGKYFGSATIAMKVSEKEFGKFIVHKSFQRVLDNKQEHTNNYHFKPISRKEYNKQREEHPELCYGSSFLMLKNINYKQKGA